MAKDYTIAEFARLLGRHPDTIRGWCRRTIIRGYKITDNSPWSIPTAELERLRGESWKEPLIPASDVQEKTFARTVEGAVENGRETSKESGSLVAETIDEHSVEIHKRDREVFKRSDKILNEERLEILFNRLLVGGRYYLIEVDMLFKFLNYFDRESNKYVSSELRYLCERFCKIIERLSHFIGIHSDVVVDWEEGLGTKYKLVPGGSFDRFYDELTNDHTRVRAERRLSDKADRLVNECRDAYREYRSIVRDTLYL